MSYHDNKPTIKSTVRMQDESKKIKEAAKNLDPENYGESQAERIAEKAVERIEEYTNSDQAMRDNEREGKDAVKKIIKQVVKEEL